MTGKPCTSSQIGDSEELPNEGSHAPLKSPFWLRAARNAAMRRRWSAVSAGQHRPTAKSVLSRTQAEKRDKAASRIQSATEVAAAPHGRPRRIAEAAEEQRSRTSLLDILPGMRQPALRPESEHGASEDERGTPQTAAASLPGDCPAADTGTDGGVPRRRGLKKPTDIRSRRKVAAGKENRETLYAAKIGARRPRPAAPERKTSEKTSERRTSDTVSSDVKSSQRPFDAKSSRRNPSEPDASSRLPTASDISSTSNPDKSDAWGSDELRRLRQGLSAAENRWSMADQGFWDAVFAVVQTRDAAACQREFFRQEEAKLGSKSSAKTSSRRQAAAVAKPLPKGGHAKSYHLTRAIHATAFGSCQDLFTSMEGFEPPTTNDKPIRAASQPPGTPGEESSVHSIDGDGNAIMSEPKRSCMDTSEATNVSQENRAYRPRFSVELCGSLSQASAADSTHSRPGSNSSQGGGGSEAPWMMTPRHASYLNNMHTGLTPCPSDRSSLHCGSSGRQLTDASPGIDTAAEGSAALHHNKDILAGLDGPRGFGQDRFLKQHKRKGLEARRNGTNQQNLKTPLAGKTGRQGRCRASLERLLQRRELDAADAWEREEIEGLKWQAENALSSAERDFARQELLVALEARKAWGEEEDT